MNKINDNSNTYRFKIEGKIPGFSDLFERHDITWVRNYPLKVILKGEEGSGKSTLGLELACAGQIIFDETSHIETLPSTRCVLYYILDHMPQRIIEKFTTFNLDRFSVDISLWNPQSPPTPLKGRTLLIIRDYISKRDSLEHLFPDIISDMTLICDKTKNKIDDFAIVVDSIAPFGKTGNYCKLENVTSSGIEFISKKDQKPLPPSVIILLDERNETEERDPYISDVYIKLWQGKTDDISREGGYCERYLQIIKAANCPHVRGPQIFRIRDQIGIEILPSLSAHHNILKNIHPIGKKRKNKMLEFGLKDLDENLESKFIKKEGEHSLARGSRSLLIGETGTLKTLLALHFFAQAIKEGGKAIFLSFHDHPKSLLDDCERMRILKILKEKEDNKNPIVVNGEKNSSQENASPISVKEGEIYLEEFADPIAGYKVTKEHRLAIKQITSRFMPPEGFIAMIKHLLTDMEIKPFDPDCKSRVIIDAVSDLNMTYSRLTGRKGFLSVIADLLYVYGITSLFLFNESKFESAEDKVIADIADNVFHIYKSSLSDISFLFHIKKFGNHFPGFRHTLQIKRNIDTEQIDIQPSNEIYRLDENQHIIPIEIKLYVNLNSKPHGEFNKVICSAYDLSQQKQLDEKVAMARGDAYEQNVKNLLQSDNSIIMAIDEAGTGRTELLKNFISLDGYIESINLEKNPFFQEAYNAGLLKDDKNDKKNTLHLLPSFVDCTVLICNIRILDKVLSEGTKTLNNIRKELHDTMNMQQESFNMDSQNVKELPIIALPDIFCAIDEFYEHIGNNSFRFFGFATDEELENIVVLFLNYLHQNHFVKKKKDSWEVKIAKASDLEKMTKIFANLSHFYLPPAGFENIGEPTTKNCLFFHTWHSKLYLENDPDLIPIKIGKNWKCVKGGWFLGILDNGLAGEKAWHILEYMSSDTMNVFCINKRVGMPSRDKFYIDTGDLSIYNLGLMKNIYKESWSRTEFDNYHIIASHIRSFLYEYKSYMERRNFWDFEKNGQFKNWLTKYICKLLENIQNINYQ